MSEMASPEKPKLKKIEEVLPSAELLALYKSRIDQFEQEREQLLCAVDRCAVHQDGVHRLEWENRKRADEIKELQKALSDAQQFLFEERQRLLNLQAENDELKLQEIQDRQRIQQLLSMTQPLEQTITYKHDGVPSSVTAYPKPYIRNGSKHPGSSADHQHQRQGGTTAAAAGSSAGAGGERVLRTVFLPTVDSEFLMMKIESLQAQLNEQRQLHEERVAALLTDRQLRAQEEERQRANLAVQVESLGKQVKQLEDTLRITTKEYILARREKQDAQAAAAAAEAQMVTEVSAARAQLAAAQKQARVDVERAANNADSKMREYVDKFRDQVRSREEELTNLVSLHTSTKASADKRIAELESRVTRLLEANRQLELRRQLDVDGWAADVTTLRKTLAAVDRKLLQMRLIERLDDDERLDKLLDQLERKVPGPESRQQQQVPMQSAAAARPAGPKRSPAGAVGRRQQTHSAGHARKPAAGIGLRSKSTGRDQHSGGLAAAAAAAGLAGADSSRLAAADADDITDDAEYSVSSVTGDGSSTVSVKSGLAAELRAVRRQLEDLEARAGNKARRALAGMPTAAAARSAAARSLLV